MPDYGTEHTKFQKPNPLVYMAVPPIRCWTKRGNTRRYTKLHWELSARLLNIRFIGHKVGYYRMIPASSHLGYVRDHWIKETMIHYVQDIIPAWPWIRFCKILIGDTQEDLLDANRPQVTQEPPGAPKKPNEQFLKINHLWVFKIMGKCCFTGMGDQKSDRHGTTAFGRHCKTRIKTLVF